jgi:lipopolysaccharide transport system ATP-binding protein
MEQIIDFSECREFIDTPVKRYSSGMYVKLAFSVAAHLDSEIMIMDEVLAVGDMKFQQKCLNRMGDAASQEGRTVLYVSHNMSTIRSLCDRCIVLDQGRIIFDGSPEEAISVYLNRGVEKNEVDIDLTAKTHLNRGLDTGLTMSRLRLEDRVTPAYDTSEVMRLRFRVNITKPLKNVRFRMILRNSIDQSVGTAWSEPTDFDETGEAEVVYRFPLNRLCRGTLYASISFCVINEGGGVYRCDHIENAFRVELSTRTGFRNWNTNQYGYVRLPDMSVERG